MLLVTLDDAHTEAERTLLLAGHAEQVLEGRRLLWEHADPDLRRIARTATGRPVRGLLSQSALDPVVSTLVFLFETEEAGRDEPLGDSLQQALGRTSAVRPPSPSD